MASVKRGPSAFFPLGRGWLAISCTSLEPPSRPGRRRLGRRHPCYRINLDDELAEARTLTIRCACKAGDAWPACGGCRGLITSGIEPEMATSRPERICEQCGRRFGWRRKWARTWDEVRYCSDRCRRQTTRSLDETLERAIDAFLSRRAVDASLCPSEVARAVSPKEWRTLMDPTRAAARRMAARGELVFTQGGRIVDPRRRADRSDCAGPGSLASLAELNRVAPRYGPAGAR